MEKQKEPEKAKRLADSVFNEVASYFSIIRGSSHITAVHESATPIQVAKHVSKHGIHTIYLDTETTSLVMHAGELSLVQVMAGSEVFLIPPVGDFAPLRELLEDPIIEVVFHSANFDLSFLQAHVMSDLKPTTIWDTKIAERVLCGGLEIGYSLDDLAERYLGVKMLKDKKLRTSFKPGQTLTDRQFIYAAMDVVALSGVAWAQKQGLERTGLDGIAQFEMELIPAVLAVSMAGMQVDVEMLEEKKRDLEAAICSSKSAAYELLDKEINLDSHPQLMSSLRDIGVRVKSTAKKSLSKVKHPIGKGIIQYRTLTKEYGGFVKGYLERVNRVSGRLYGDFQQVGTATGRFSCRRPNLQQVPRNGGLRGAFHAAPGYSLIVADFGQIELRIAAELSQDPTLIELFQDGRDFHTETAARIHMVSLDEVTPEMRNKAKGVNFGVTYGMGLGSLAEHIGSTRTEAANFYRRYFKPYKELQKYRRAYAAHALRRKYSKTLWGRIRYYNSPRSRSWSDWELKNRGMNTPVQGSCGDIFKLALLGLYIQLADYDARVVNLIHDEVIVEVAKDQVEEVKNIVHEMLIKAGEYFIKSVPVVVDLDVRKRWAK